MEDNGAKGHLFIVSWILGMIGLFFIVKHSFSTGNIMHQPDLIIAKMLLVVGVFFALPYDWSLPLQRYRLIADAIAFSICIALLLRAPKTAVTPKSS